MQAPVVRRKSVSNVVRALMVLAATYVLLGVGFHFASKAKANECRELRRAQGEFVETEVLGGLVGLAIDIVFWPLPAGANLANEGTAFATPCTH